MRPTLPPSIAKFYRPLTGNEVRAESFGELKIASFRAPQGEWPFERGTFDDQAIFGPVSTWRCACGKYASRESDGIVCDECGVKVTTREVRRSRCAHINLPEPMPHPLDDSCPALTALPVLPVAFIEAPSGMDLLLAYDSILRWDAPRDRGVAFETLLNTLTPLLVLAHNWNLPQRSLIAHGMALKYTAER